MKLGKYIHYKGKEYEVLGIARSSEDLSEHVVYKALYPSEFGEGTLWIRPKEMFFSHVEKNGISMPRFRHIDDIQE